MENRESIIATKKVFSVRQALKKLLKYFGPAFVVSVAYIDPGNFATNISGGSIFNYHLIWVILCSNIMAIFLQIMSAKLGIATGRNLPEMCNLIFKRKVNWLLWITAELAAMATDLAEFLGGTLGLYLLFHIPLMYAGPLTGVITFIIVYLEKYGQKIVEIVIFALVAIISLSYTFELFLAKPDWGKVMYHTVIPSIPNGEAMLIAVGILGATVMPHVIYLHSQLVQYRNTGNTLEEKKEHLRMEKIDILVAMNIAFIINAAMLIVSAAVFYKNGIVVGSIEEAHMSLKPLLGPLSSWAFGIALLASGLSSSAVGTMAGQTIMKGFVGLNIPLNVRRLITMMPALIIILLGIDPLKTLIISQVILSFELPMAIIPMLLVTSQKKLMGEFVNTPIEKVIGIIVASIIIFLNGLLLYFTFMGEV
ncbi:manganese transport protein [Thermoanaerobacter uzonensis DSM 18761]|uniref:Divalent metal cation transporter MntH n=1 Tax=Thermoanaerobacter uzonensis DSM 18761 TaxID=1123369 RepID=A0A1M4YQ71_9THEO|nr:Nramp family divalent metal transporter [Thermoanaerobacter uzonensis]SHF07787.1 manganese transport protein [Thermoanaerobacter uzonensis DSM 18761]